MSYNRLCRKPCKEVKALDTIYSGQYMSIRKYSGQY